MMREWVKVCSLFCWVLLLELPVGRPGGDPNLCSNSPQDHTGKVHLDAAIDEPEPVAAWFGQQEGQRSL